MNEIKILGEIASAEFGMVPDHPFLMGLQLSFKLGDGSGVGCGEVYTENISPACRFNNKSRAECIADIMDKTATILKQAGVNHVSELVNKPVEVTLDGNLFKDFRILTEVL